MRPPRALLANASSRLWAKRYVVRRARRDGYDRVPQERLVTPLSCLYYGYVSSSQIKISTQRRTGFGRRHYRIHPVVTR
jgi:hypothetical protein